MRLVSNYFSTMEWFRSILRYSDLEEQLLNSDTEPALFKQNSELKEFGGTKLRIVNVPPSNDVKGTEQLYAVFLHGLGGNAECFAHLSECLASRCGILAIDLPGSGLSPIPEDKDAYQPGRIVELINTVIESTCKSTPFVMIGHSYGTSHALRVASGRLQKQCLGAVCITPPFNMDMNPIVTLSLNYMPVWLFDVAFRSRDRVGGLHSASVNRMLADGAHEQARKQQLKTNLHSKTSVFLETVTRMKFYDPKIDALPTFPVLIIGAVEDQVCPISKSKELFEVLKQHTDTEFYEIQNAGHSVIFEKPEQLGEIVTDFIVTKVCKDN